MPSLVLNRFRPLEVLAVGPLGTIHTALDQETGRKVAFRVFSPPEGGAAEAWDGVIALLNRELGVVRGMDHPGIARVYDFGVEDRLYYIVTEWFDGEALRLKLDRGERRTPEAVLRMVGQAGRALEYAAERGIYHGDVTPYNLILSSDGSVHLVNFGVARVRPKGDSPYRAPEEVEGREGDCRSDLFSLGLILFELLERRHPFLGATVDETQEAILRAPLPPLTTAPPTLRPVLEKLLAKDVTARYQSWGEVAADLVRLQSAHVERAEPQPDAAISGAAQSRLHLSEVLRARKLRGDRHAALLERVRSGAGLLLRWGTLTLALAGVGHALWRRGGEHDLSVRSWSGNVEVTNQFRRQWRKATVGEELELQDAIRTRAASQAVLEVGDGSRLQLGPESLLTVHQSAFSRTAGKRLRSFQLNGGQAWVQCRPRPNQRFTVVVPGGVVSTSGGEFRVRVVPTGGAQVAFLSGHGTVRGNNADVAIGPGQQLSVREDEEPSAASTLSAAQVQAVAVERRALRLHRPASVWLQTVEGWEDATVTPLADGVASLAAMLPTPELFAQASARKRAEGALVGLGAALEQQFQLEGAYPEALNPRTLEPLSGAAALRTALLGQFKNHQLGYYKRTKDGYEVSAPIDDISGEPVYLRNGKVVDPR